MIRSKFQEVKDARFQDIISDKFKKGTLKVKPLYYSIIDNIWWIYFSVVFILLSVLLLILFY